MVGNDVSGSELATRIEVTRRFEKHLLKKSYKLLSRGSAPTEVRGRRGMPATLNGVGWYLVVSIGQMVKP